MTFLFPLTDTYRGFMTSRSDCLGLVVSHSPSVLNCRFKHFAPELEAAGVFGGVAGFLPCRGRSAMYANILEPKKKTPLAVNSSSVLNITTNTEPGIFNTKQTFVSG